MLPMHCKHSSMHHPAQIMHTSAAFPQRRRANIVSAAMNRENSHAFGDSSCRHPCTASASTPLLLLLLLRLLLQALADCKVHESLQMKLLPLLVLWCECKVHHKPWAAVADSAAATAQARPRQGLGVGRGRTVQGEGHLPWAPALQVIMRCSPQLMPNTPLFLLLLLLLRHAYDYDWELRGGDRGGGASNQRGGGVP